MNIRQYKRFCRSLKDLRFSFCHQISIQIPKLHLPDSQPAYNASCVAFLTVFQLFAGKFSLLFWDRNLYRFQSQLFIPPWRCALNFNRVFTWTTTDYHRAPTDSMAFLLYSVSWLAHRVECAVRKKNWWRFYFCFWIFGYMCRLWRRRRHIGLLFFHQIFFIHQVFNLQKCSFIRTSNLYSV